MHTIAAFGLVPRLLSVFVLVTSVSCDQPPPPPPVQPVSTISELMQGVLDPAADVLWGSAGSIITLEGEEDLSPKTEEEWLAVWHSGIQLSEAGNLLMLGERARDNDEWMRLAGRMVEVGLAAQKAARSQDPDAVLEVGEQVYIVCTDCHTRYWEGGRID